MRKYTVFDVGNNSEYFDNEKNKEVMEKVARKCYLPANRLMLELIHKHKGRFRISYSITGMVLKQFERFQPRVIDSFRRLAKTGCVEFLAETYNHSLAYLYSKPEFYRQVSMHIKKMKQIFGVTPRIFRNTELIYNNALAMDIERMGFNGILAEGADHILGWRSPNFVYRPVTCKRIKLLVKNYKLSDDIAFRFSNQGWEEYPLTMGKFSQWINAVNGNGQCVNLFMDYETFGEHQWATTGIFRFMKELPAELLKHRDNDFKTPSEVIASYEPASELDIPHPVSWADIERDVSAWTGNKMQKAALEQLYQLENEVLASGDGAVIEDWRNLTTSDHFYYMCTKWFADGDVHKYFNPYDSPYDSFIAFMTILDDIRLRLGVKAMDGTKRPGPTEKKRLGPNKTKRLRKREVNVL